MAKLIVKRVNLLEASFYFLNEVRARESATGYINGKLFVARYATKEARSFCE